MTILSYYDMLVAFRVRLHSNIELSQVGKYFILSYREEPGGSSG